MKAMTNLIKQILLNMGWELKRTNMERQQARARACSIGALKWIDAQNIPVHTILDIGASNGSWTAHCMTAINAKEFVLFEPQPVHSEELKRFKETVKQPVHLVQKAVGASEGHTYFDAADPFGGALGSAPGANMIEVPMTSVDSSVASLGLKGPFLLKLDTHGFEPSILKGAEKTLEDCSVIFIEAYTFHISNEAILFWEICTLLAQRGFRCVDIVDIVYRKSDSALWQMDLMFIKDDWEGFSRTTFD